MHNFNTSNMQADSLYMLSNAYMQATNWTSHSFRMVCGFLPVKKTSESVSLSNSHFH